MFSRRTKGRVHYNTFNEQQKCHVTNIYTVEEKQKYHITSCSSKLSENVFVAAFVMMKLQQ